MSTDPIAVLRQNSQRPMVLQTHLLDLTRVAIASTSFPILQAWQYADGILLRSRTALWA
ncbi:hypothetical protein NDI49_09425 [Trichocoleus sp. ST-U3]|uniref:hypothetical protein n=1 Tax=Coleofasciculus sp. FACHB-542 TaxID=2692787 RepID=UPI001688238D|nr:hypothetical protein [Coleofasciculus sp. FACHB-542]